MYIEGGLIWSSVQVREWSEIIQKTKRLHCTLEIVLLVSAFWNTISEWISPAEASKPEYIRNYRIFTIWNQRNLLFWMFLAFSFPFIEKFSKKLNGEMFMFIYGPFGQISNCINRWQWTQFRDCWVNSLSFHKIIYCSLECPEKWPFNPNTMSDQVAQSVVLMSATASWGCWNGSLIRFVSVMTGHQTSTRHVCSPIDV